LKDLFANYLKGKGHDMNMIWKQVDKAITIVSLRNEYFFVKEASGFEEGLR
jgi:hypothetical protein